MDKQKVLDNLYALRAGLSAISQEYDKARAIDDECDERLNESAKNFCGDLTCYSLRPHEYSDDYFYQLEKLQKRYGYIEDYETKIKNGEIQADETVSATHDWTAKIRENNLKAKKAYNRWLADDECDGYFDHVWNIANDEKRAVTNNQDIYKQIKSSKKRLIVFFSIAAVLTAILTAMLAGAFGKWNEGKADVIAFIVLTIVFLLLLGFGIANVYKFKKNTALHEKEIAEAEDLCNTARELIHDLPQNKEKTRAILKEKDEKIAPIKQSCNDFYMALKKQFNSLLDERDWQNLDLVIYEIETRRAESIKEALQLVDRELQTERIERTIGEATKTICYTLQRGFTYLQQSIETCCNKIYNKLDDISSKLDTISTQMTVQSLQLAHMGGQLAELCDSVNMSNALQAKANVTSKQLLSDVHAIRYYQ